MQFLYLAFPSHNLNATAAAVWEAGINAAAVAAGVPVQLCMDLPNDITSSVLYNAVTNARASEDDFPTNDGRWDIGTTALLYGAFDIAPFYDDTWTTAVQEVPDTPYPGAAENFTELSVMISVLSTGLVGFSDHVGFTNASLLNMTAMADGRLLKPSRPAAAIDATFAITAGAAPAGSVWAAPAFIAGGPIAAFPSFPIAGSVDAVTGQPFFSILCVDVNVTFTLFPWDLSPDLTGLTSGGYVAVPWSPGMVAVQQACADGAPASGCVTAFGPTAPLVLRTGAEAGDHSKPHELWHLSPLYDNGYALIGELGKVTRVSVQRFAWATVVDTDGGPPHFRFAVNGTAGETVVVTVLAPAATTTATVDESVSLGPEAVQGVMRTVSVPFAAAGRVRVDCIGAGAAAACVATPDGASDIDAAASQLSAARGSLRTAVKDGT